ncbi:DUF1178 family protein [Candidatus Pelagibacter sp.]|nr:DUF1178 family protein [Candidatus Pelagibacter sp.]
MIKYRLSCKNCKLIFDSWFATSKEYDKLKKKKLLNCYNCNSLKVEKTLMAPKLINKDLNNNSNKELQKYNNTIKKYQEFIKKNFEYVGENFSQKVRSIHYNDNKKKKGIYGTASKKDLEELKEEGIDTKIIPWIEDKDN